MKKIYTLALIILGCSGLQGQSFENLVDFGASFPNNSRSKIIALSDGGFIHMDELWQELDIDPGAGVTMVNGEQLPGLILSRHAANGDLVWWNFIGNSTNTSYFDLSMAPDGRINVCGSFGGTVDFDSGPNEAILTSSSGGDIFVATYNLDGSVNWVKSLTVESELYACIAQTITTDSNGEVLVGGYFSGTIDFDPGNDEYLVDAYGDDIDAYLVRLDANGNFVYVHTFSGEMYDYMKFIACDSDNNYVINGVIRQSADIDPGAGELFITSGENTEVEFLAKYDQDGNLAWGFAFESNASNGIETDLLHIDAEGNVIMTGISVSSVDFDPGEGEAWFYSDYIGWYIVKYSPDGEFLWLSYGDDATVMCSAIDSEGNIFMSGLAGLNCDLDGGLGNFNPNENSNGNFFCSKYNSSGIFMWGFGLGSSGGIADSWPTDIEVNNNGDVVLAGLYQSNLDVDPGAGSMLLTAMPNNWPLFVATYSEGPCSNTSLNITEASNLSCEDYSGTLSAAFVNGVEPFSYQWNTGETTSSIEALSIGVYTVYGVDGNGCEVQRDIIVSGPVSFDNFDLNPNAMAWSFVPGFDTYIQLDAFNEGCAYATGSLILTLDPALTLLNVTPPADNIDGNVITWNFANINYDSEHLTPTVVVNTPVETPLGDIMNLTVEMTPSSGDYFVDNNIKNYEYVVVGSYDPNIIEVYPKGTGEEGYINANETMTYTIHFQNTGTAPAVNVYILDVIDSDLDINTVQILGSSHAMHTEVENGNTLRFVFDNIMLPDSTNNEPESHGYVIYTIEQQPDLPYFTEMENTAAIYFDFNAPVITNTVLNTIQGPVFVDEDQARNDVRIYPSPATEMITIDCGPTSDNFIQIISMEGRMVQTFRSLQNKTMFNAGSLAPGVYEVRVTDENGAIRNSRFVKK